MSAKSYTRVMTALASVCFLFLASSIGGDWKLFSETPVTESIQSVPTDLEQLARTVAGRELSDNFALSLKAREAADFLLTPAILNRDCITHGVLITYPTE